MFHFLTKDVVALLDSPLILEVGGGCPILSYLILSSLVGFVLVRRVFLAQCLVWFLCVAFLCACFFVFILVLYFGVVICSISLLRL